MAKIKIKENVIPEKAIIVKCKGAANLSIDSLTELQGDLKSLSDDNYEKLKRQIIDMGFSAPFFIWQNEEKNSILDGHQRLKTLKKMRDEEGYTVPKLPVVYVEADNEVQAKKKILGLVSQYGEITFEGLDKFIKEAEASVSELTANFRLPDLNIASFEKYLKGPEEKDYSGKNKEIDTDTFGNDLGMKCPRCSFEFAIDVSRKG
jgi:hypothetical protein